MTSKEEELYSYFNKQNLKFSLKRKEKKLYVTDKNNVTKIIDITNKEPREIIAQLYLDNKNKSINSSNDFVTKFNQSFEKLSKAIKKTKFKELANSKKLISVYFINVLNYIIKRENILNLTNDDITKLPESNYPYIRVNDSSEKIVVDLNLILDYYNPKENNNILKSSVLKKRYEIAESFFVQNKKKLNSIFGKVAKSKIDDDSSLKDFIELINLLFEKASYENRSTRSNKSYSYGDEEKYQEIKISNYEEALNNGFSGSPKSIFKALESLKINYKDPNNAHFSGKLIARIIIEGLGKEFVLRSHKFAKDPYDNRIYMDASVKGKEKFLWCGATIAFMFKDKLSPSIRKAFRGTSALFYSFGNDKDICVYKRSDGYYPTERQLKAGDVICISSNNSGESGGKSSQKFGNHIGVISSVNIVNGRVKSVETYEGNTYKGGRNTVAQRKRKVDEIIVAYRFIKNEKISSKYELFNSAFPGMKTNDYQILYSIFFTSRIKKLNTPDKIIKYMSKKKEKANAFYKKYLRNKEVLAQTKNTLKNLLGKFT